MSYLGQSPGQGMAEYFLFTASGSETSVTTADDGRPVAYTVGQVSVYLNGVRLVEGSGKDFQATNGSSITGLSALTASDVVEVVALSTFSPADAVSAANGGTFSGNVVVGATNANQTLDIASHDLVDGGLKLGGTLVTSSATELNVLDGKSATDLVPSNIVCYRASGESTPSGWSEYTSVRGRMIVGLPSGGTDGGTVGTALTNTQDKTHTHAITHTHKIALSSDTSSVEIFGQNIYGSHSLSRTNKTGSGSDTGTANADITDGVSTANSGTSATSDVLAYIQLMAIKKD